MAPKAMYDVAFYLPHGGGRLASPAQPTGGGAETQVAMLSRALAGRGFRVAVIVAGDPIPQSAYAKTEKVDVIAQPAIREGDRTVDTVARTWETLAALARTPARAFVQRGASGATGLARLAAWKRRARFVFSSANVEDFSFEQVEPARRTRALYALGARRADEIVVQTTEQIALCEAAFGRSPRLIRSLAEPRPLPAGPQEAFLWVGRTAGHKHPELYAELASRVPEVQFWMIMVPSGDEREAIEAQMTALIARTPNLTLLEPRPHEQVGELIGRSVAVVNTSEREGFSNVVLEAWSRGVPSLVLNHDPDGLIERERLGGFADGSVDRLAELARELWADRDERGALAERCRSWIAEQHAAGVVVDAWCEALGLPKRANAHRELEAVR